MSIGKKIKDLRLRNNLTQEELADKLHVTRNAVSKWENDKGFPNMESLKDLAKLFDVSLDYLFGEEEIIKTTIENKQKNEINNNLLFSIILFISFTIIGITIPYYFHKLEDDSIMIAIILILPMAYTLLGVLSVLSTNKISFVSIAAGLALVPIYVFFDLYIEEVTFGLWGILYFAIFLLVYLLLSKILSIKLTKKRIKSLEIIFMIVALSIVLIFCIHTIIEIINLISYPGNSAPWYVVLVVNTYLYIIPFTVTFVLFLYYKMKGKKILI